MSSPSRISRSVLEIGFCSNMDMGVAISDFSPIFEIRHAAPAKYHRYV